MKFLNYFLKLDIFGKSPHFNINGKKKYKTYIGSIFTCIVYILITLIIIIGTKEVIFRKNLKIITTINNKYERDYENISLSSFIIALGLQDINYTNYIDESIYILNAYIYDTTRNESGTPETEITKLKVTKCDLLNITIIPEFFKGVGMNNLYCLNESYVILKGEFGEINWRYLIFSFSKCRNSTENNFSCKSEEEINRVLQGGYFGAFVADSFVNNKDHKNPIIKYGKNFFTAFTIKQYQDLWIYLKKIRVITDIGYIFEDKEIGEEIALDKYESTIDYREDNIFYSAKFRLSTKLETYERSYTKAAEAIGFVGGFMKIILVISKVSVSYFNSLLFQKYLIQFFRFDENDINNSNHKYTTSININPKKSREITNTQTFNANNSKLKFKSNSELRLNFPNINLRKVNFVNKKHLSVKKLNYISLESNKFFMTKVHKSKRKEYRFWFSIYCKKRGFQKAKEIYKKYKLIIFLTDIIYYYKSLFKIQLLEYNFFDMNKRKTIIETDCFDYCYFNEEKNCYDIKHRRPLFLNVNYKRRSETPNIKLNRLKMSEN